MRALMVALVHRTAERLIDRTVGWWSYPVPEFEWRHFSQPKRFTLDRSEFRGFDLALWEDGKTDGVVVGKGPPVAYHVVDSTLSREHYQHRLAQAKQCDLVLVDHDLLERFIPTGKPVRRFAYCVNDRLFRDYGEAKTVEVAYHCALDGPRAELRDWLAATCAERGWTLTQGVLEKEDYARALARAKLVVNLGRTPENRPHRTFDAMAAGACLLTSPLPEVSGEKRVKGTHYLEWGDRDELLGLMAELLNTGRWRDIAAEGRALVRRFHTWAERAKELRATLKDTLGL